MTHGVVDRIDKKRATHLATVSRWYSPHGHLLATVGICAAGACIAFSQVGNASWREYLITAICTLLFANFIEWFMHKTAMHHPRAGFRSTYEGHTLRHHGIYLTERMEISDRREWKFVLMGAKDFCSLLVIAIVIACTVGFIVHADTGWIWFAIQMLYVCAYELTHLTYHLPATHPARRLPFMETLRRHHAVHHDQGLMGKYNFNITIPLADIVFRTMAPAKRLNRRTPSRTP